MNKKDPDICCDICECHDQIVAEIVEIGYPQSRSAKICDDCVSELQECEFSGSLHTPDEEMHTLENGTVVCDYIREHECGWCEWSDTLHLHENMLSLGDGQMISPDYEDETRICYETGERYHTDDMVYNDDYGEWFHQDYAPEVGDRWYNTFSKVYCQNFNYPVRNFVGIEFEAEEGSSIGPDSFTDTFIAEAKEDGSLSSDGTEYTTHPIRGDDIENVVDEMMTRFQDNGMSLPSSVGWHFHWEADRYGVKAQKNLWNVVDMFQNILQSENKTSGFHYFSDMLRGYADLQHSSYTDWAKAWSDSQVDYEYRDHFRRYEPHNAQSPRAFVNFSNMRNRDGKRIEVRLYKPSSVLDVDLSQTGWDRRYKSLGEDYKMFIRFWDELFRKAVHRFNDISFSRNMIEFASQFTAPTRNWLNEKELIYKKNV